jgi:hypothetical protein
MAFSDLREAAQDAYRFLASDLIRTGSVLMNLSPVACFRAQSIFHRFMDHVERLEGVANGARQRQPPPPFVAGKPAPCYDMHSYVDIYERLHRFRNGDDTIVYVAAASVLISCKAEDHHRIRSVVHTFNCLRKKCRCPNLLVSIDEPAEYLEALKDNIVMAESQILHDLGFQTVVETPHKFIVIFVALLVDESKGDDAQRLKALWAKAAAMWANDTGRYRQLVQLPPPVAACGALYSSASACGVILPAEWSAAFGVSKSSVSKAVKAFDECCAGVKSAMNSIIEAMVMQPRPAAPPPPPPPPQGSNPYALGVPVGSLNAKVLVTTVTTTPSDLQIEEFDFAARRKQQQQQKSAAAKEAKEAKEKKEKRKRSRSKEHRDHSRERRRKSSN